jgi:hypothetical protein
VTSSSGITLVAAHGNRNTTTDDDIIYDAGIEGPSREGTDVTFDETANTVEQDYPLFWFWGYNTTTSASIDADADGFDTTTRAVLKLSGVTTIDTSDAQAYMYTPEAVDTDQGETAAGDRDSFTDTCLLDETEIDAYIHATPVVSGITRSNSLAINTDALNPTEVTATAVDTSNHYFQLADVSDVFNVGANVNGNLQSDASRAALIVGLPIYGGATWDSPEDTLVIEDVVLDGVAHTLHFKIPQFVTADHDETANSALKTAETDNLPQMFVYRKVSLDQVDLMPSGNNDVCSAANVRTGNLVEDSYDPTGLVFSFREDLSAAPTVAWRDGDDNDPIVNTTTGELEGYNNLFGSPTSNLVASNPDQARIRLHDITEPTDGFIGHDAQIDVTSTDLAGNTGTFTVTLRLGHGAADSVVGVTMKATAPRGAGSAAAIDDGGGAGANGVVIDPILNVIGVLGDIHNESDATDTTGGSDDSVE